MVSSFFINAHMLIAFISVSYHFHYERKDFYLRHKAGLKVILGIGAGFGGILLMVYSYRLESGIVIDYRNFAIIISV